MWRLADIGDPNLTDRSDDAVIIEINDCDVLRRDLNRIRHGSPRLFIFAAPDGAMLRFGLGGRFGVVQCMYAPQDKNTAYPIAPQAPAPIEFFAEGLGEPFFPENLLSADEVIEIVDYYFRTRELADWVKWGPRSWGMATSEERKEGDAGGKKRRRDSLT